MEYCGPRGIPFEDWLEWGDLSKAMALAWQARRADVCPNGCGQHRTEWLDDDGIELRVRPARVVPVYCPSCDDLARARKAHGDLEPGVSLGWAANEPASSVGVSGESTVTG